MLGVLFPQLFQQPGVGAFVAVPRFIPQEIHKPRPSICIMVTSEHTPQDIELLGNQLTKAFDAVLSVRLAVLL